MKKTIVFLLLLLCAVGVFAQGASEEAVTSEAFDGDCFLSLMSEGKYSSGYAAVLRYLGRPEVNVYNYGKVYKTYSGGMVLTTSNTEEDEITGINIESGYEDGPAPTSPLFSGRLPYGLTFFESQSSAKAKLKGQKIKSSDGTIDITLPGQDITAVFRGKVGLISIVISHHGDGVDRSKKNACFMKHDNAYTADAASYTEDEHYDPNPGQHAADPEPLVIPSSSNALDDLLNNIADNKGSNDDACQVILQLAERPSDNFNDIKGAVRSDGKGTNATLAIPGAKESYIEESREVYKAVLGNTPGDADVKFDQYVSKLKSCLPDYYVELAQDKYSRKLCLFGKRTSDGYIGPIGQLRIAKDEDGGMAELLIYHLSPGRFYTIKGAAGSSPFANNLRKLTMAGTSSFSDVKTNEQTSSGLDASTHYDISIPIEGATCGITENMFSLDHGCGCLFAKGMSQSEAEGKYNTILEKCKAAYGSEWVYTDVKPMLSRSSDIKVISFGLKKQKGYEQNIPVARLGLYKWADNTYSIVLKIPNNGNL